MDFLTYAFIFVLAMFLGVELIRRVPAQLHTPLMSGSNAISGISLIGAMVVVASAGGSGVVMFLGGLAVAFAALNVVGGYVVTDRMLAMFKSGKPSGGSGPEAKD